MQLHTVNNLKSISVNNLSLGAIIKYLILRQKALTAKRDDYMYNYMQGFKMYI